MKWLRMHVVHWNLLNYKHTNIRIHTSAPTKTKPVKIAVSTRQDNSGYTCGYRRVRQCLDSIVSLAASRRVAILVDSLLELFCLFRHYCCVALCCVELYRVMLSWIGLRVDHWHSINIVKRAQNESRTTKTTITLT